MKVLFHIDESSRWKMALGNVSNMMEYGESTSILFEIEIVANGPAVKELQKDCARQAGLLEQLESLAPGVRISACSNALSANGISSQALLDFVQVVPAGVVEIARRQEEGYSYIKP